MFINQILVMFKGGIHFAKHVDKRQVVIILPKTNTPWKINMEPTNHPFRKESDLPNLHDYVPC